MPSPKWSNDDELMADLAKALKPRHIDEEFLTAARGAFAWRTIDLELATLFYDSSLDDAILVRGGSEPRILAFQSDALGVEIELSEAGILGQVLPPQPGVVALVHSDGTRATAPVDDVGYFSFPMPGHGSLRLECTTDSGGIVTDWVTI